MPTILAADMPHNPNLKEVDLEPGDYFVSCIRGNGDAALVSGPYSSHQQALDDVFTVKHVAEEFSNDPHVFWFRWGTCRLKPESGVVGVLQKAGVYEVETQKRSRSSP